MRAMKVDNLAVEIHQTRQEMGRAAAAAGLKKIREALREKAEINLIFAAAPSQAEVLDNLRSAQEVDWTRVNAFHMDNYVGLDESAPQQFSTFLRTRLFSVLPFKSVHCMGTQAGQEETYAALLDQRLIDVCFMGIGENGHIAFNDPVNALFDDPEIAKQVALDLQCRTQQVNEGNFQALSEVPTHALTLTIPTLMRSRHLICTVPGLNKARAVQAMLEGPITESCPASVLRRHPSAVMFLDEEAAALLRSSVV